MSLAWQRAGIVILFFIGILIIAFGFYEMYRFVIGVFPYRYADSGVYGIFSIVLGFAIVRFTYPIFIPIKKNNLESIRTCPYCGATVKENATECEKCKQQLD
jgi:hypothetical protein